MVEIDIISMSIATLAVLFSLNFMAAQFGSPKGSKFIARGFLVLLAAHLFSLLHGWLVPVAWNFIYLVLKMSAACLLILGALTIRNSRFKTAGVRAVLFSVAVAWALLLVVFVDPNSGEGKDLLLYHVADLIPIAAAFAVTGASFIHLRSLSSIRRHGGFLLTGGAFVVLALGNLMKLTEGGHIFMTVGPVEPALYAILTFGIILICNNVLQSQLDVVLAEVRESKTRLRLIIQSSPFPIIISRLKDDQLLLANRKAVELLNIDADRLFEFRTVDYFADPSSRQQLLNQLEQSEVVENFEILLRPHGSKEASWFLQSSRVIDFEHEIALYSAFQDITSRKQKELKLYDQATRDPLTNCYNRRQFNELVNKEISKARRSRRPFCLFMIDADHFKRVNDTYGHSDGDEVLKALANCCRKTLRESDIIARFGGEEFVIFMPETRVDMAFRVCDRLRVEISNLEVKTELHSIHFTVSMGLVESTEDDTLSLENLLKLADEALYIAKESGRNRVIIGAKDNADAMGPLVEAQPLVVMKALEGDNDAPLPAEEGVLPKASPAALEELADKEDGEGAEEPPLPPETFVPQANEALFKDDASSVKKD